MNRKPKNWLPRTLVAIALVAAFGISSAQDFRTFGGSNERTGRSTLQASTAVPETTWGNAGRGFLRWWDPIFDNGALLNNGDVGTAPGLGVWSDPTPAGGAFVLASNYIDSAVNAPYLYSVTSATGGNDGPNPSLGSTAAFSWTFNTLSANSEYSIEVNLPSGPTNINPLGVPDLRFTPHYQLYSVTDVAGTTYHWLDMRSQGGGFASVGNGQIFTSTAGGVITVTLFNVCRRNDFGTLIDSSDQPGIDIVYADAVQMVNKSPRGVANYVASPVVGQLLQPRLDAQPTVFDQRVVTARNEDVFVGSLNKQVRFGVLTSFTHNGAVVDAGAPLRRNMVWSWPSVRPFDLTTLESNRYALDRQAWITGGPNSNYPRNLVFRQADNLSAATAVGAGFANAIVFNSVGPDYLIAPAVLVASTFATFAPEALPGRYFIEVRLPTNDLPGDLATQVTYEILQGGIVIATRQLDQSTANGWVRLSNQGEGFDHNTGLTNLPLTVRVLDRGSNQDVIDGRSVVADAVRFVGDADLGITATPVQTVATVNTPGPTAVDVVLAARENGTLVAMEAHGDEVTGTAPNVFWTWPSEDPTTDPNAAAGEDGGIASTPTNFGMSSPLVTNVGGVDLAFIGSQNGQVYSLDMAGRGDGTTTRRWTWPDDYDPTNATNTLTPTNVGTINGSVALAQVGGNPAIIVPGERQVFALDAAGNAGSKTTTVLWQYPPVTTTVQNIKMAPVVAFGRVYFAGEDTANPGQGIVYCLDENTGALIWQRTVRGDGITPFGLFGSASPVAVEAPIIANDSLFFVDDGGFITSLDAATGAVNWEEASVASGATASLRFAYMRLYENTATAIQNAIPTVLVASNAGTLMGFYADGSLNPNGNRLNWGFYVDSTDTQVASFAVGGWPNAAGFLANRSHLYIGDAGGILYAFSSEDDNNSVAPITPGNPPGSPSGTPNDPNQAELNDMIQQDDVLLLSPDEYQDLLTKGQAGTLAYTDITHYKAVSILRRAFEMGETQYLAVVDINASTVPSTSGYSLQARVTSGSSKLTVNSSRIYNVTGAPSPQEAGVAIMTIQLRPIGSSAIIPGVAKFEVSARSAPTGGRSPVTGTPQDLSTSVNTPAGGDFEIANPFGIELPEFNGTMANALGTNDAGLTTNVVDPLVRGNNPLGYNGISTPYDKWTNGFIAPTAATGVPGSWVSSIVGGVDPVSHNSSGITQMRLFDRTLTSLIDGPGRGLSNVRVQSNDLVWQPDVSGIAPTTAAQAGVYKPLPFSGFEDYPLNYPNTSLDYPDLNRGGLSMGAVSGQGNLNPLYSLGIQLTDPTITPADRSTYNTTAGYEAGLTTRTLNGTLINTRLNIPQYQPATVNSATRPSGYVSKNVVFVGPSNRAYDSSFTGRGFTLAVNVGIDENISTQTKTVDLGSLPAGGGFYDSIAGQPSYPTAAGAFAPFNPGFLNINSPQFQQVTGFNEGNVNLLNVRVSRRVGELSGINQVERPLELYSPSQHELAWLDASAALYSDLDPLLSPTFRTGLDANGNIFLQKPRPGDPAPSRLSTNPRRRQNSNLNTVSGSLIANTALFPGGDPYVGVAAPLGTPVGSYVRQIYLFEDFWAPGSVDYGAAYPSLGYYLGPTGFTPEAYTNPSITLKFNIRETRLTTQSTAKSLRIFDTVPVGDAGFNWSSRQPTMARRANGDFYFAFSSNREDAAGAGINPRAKVSTDGRNQSIWRIYFGSSATAGANPMPSQSPIADMNFFAPDSANQWLGYRAQLPVGNEWNNWFAVGAGEALVAPTADSSARFIYPTFASQMFINPLDPATPTRNTPSNRYIAFVGETTKVDRTGNKIDLSQVMLANMDFTNTVARVNTGALNGVFPIDLDPTSKKGRPAIVQQGANVAVFYPAQSAGRTEIYSANFDGATYSNVQSLGVGSIFEEISGITANLRSVSAAVNPTGAVMDTFFTGQVRGRQNAEAFQGQLAVGANGMPVANQQWTVFEDRLDRLDYDPSTGVFWTPGVDWALTPADVNAFELLILNPVTGTLTPLINNNPLVPADMRSRVVDRETRELVFESPNGGKVYVDARRGSIRLSGVATGRNTQIFARYSPTFVRVSGVSTAFRIGTGEIAQANASAGSNYRGASAVFDDRLLGVYNDPTQPSRNLLEDLNFWYSNIGGGANAGLLTQDRYYLSFNRTSNDGAAAARPVLSTMRFGIHLMTPIAINPNPGPSQGLPYSLTVTGLAGNAVQADPISGKLYVPASEEGRTLQITYTGIDINGQLLPNLQIEGKVSLIVETGESLVPIEQVGQEGDFFMSLDRVQTNNSSLLQRRPPMLWMIWSSTRSGSQDVYLQTYAPKTTPRVQRP
ncbi:MAG: PQQ-binding-like beta-propeller repeat protein [Fimbriimonadaceae bacterium]